MTDFRESIKIWLATLFKNCSDRNVHEKQLSLVESCVKSFFRTLHCIIWSSHSKPHSSTLNIELIFNKNPQFWREKCPHTFHVHIRYILQAFSSSAKTHIRMSRILFIRNVFIKLCFNTLILYKLVLYIGLLFVNCDHTIH